MNPEEVSVEARARIIWGEEPASVYAFMTSNGMSAADAGRKIQELVAERNQEVRKIGVRGICLGAAVILVVVILIWDGSKHPTMSFRARQGEVCVFFGGLYGIWKLIDGLFHLLRPQLETRSIPDLEE